MNSQLIAQKEISNHPNIGQFSEDSINSDCNLLVQYSKALDDYVFELYGQRALKNHSAYSFKFQINQGNIEAYYESISKRLKLFDITPDQFNKLGEQLADESLPCYGKYNKAFSKLILYSQPGYENDWLALGFICEGVIKGFFKNGKDAEIWSAFTDLERFTFNHEKKNDEIIELALDKEDSYPKLPERYRCHVAKQEDACEIAEVMNEVFDERYPAKIQQPIISKMIRTKSNHFRIVRDTKENIASVASAEMYYARNTAEMGECATLPKHRQKGLMTYLLWRIESDIKNQYDIDNLFALARANQSGVNCAFSKLGYEYNGRLHGHSYMPEGLESMNIWCKSLS